MTLLSICQDVAAEAGVQVPSTIVGNTDGTAVRLLALANREGKRQAKRANWSFLHQEHTFDLLWCPAISGVAIAGCSEAGNTDGNRLYDLPDDFSHFLNRTTWNRDEQWTVAGPVSPAQWQTRYSGLSVSSETNRVWRIRAFQGVKKFLVDPRPSEGEDGETIVFEYVSKNWVNNAGTLADSFQSDSDTVLLDDYLFKKGLIWRFLYRMGLNYQAEKAEYEALMAKISARDGGEALADMSGRDEKRFPHVQEGSFPS